MLIEEIEFYNVNGKKNNNILNDRRTSYVGNLPKNCRKQDLRDLFEPNYGKITINMLKKKATQETAEKVCIYRISRGCESEKSEREDER
ncbi:ANM_collapsed_G0035460.mRNA.1.CDS.1 [Saccharomyces cerevisiae]|nr:ANM_collapsed_G0035460.mRNA.1.CDS.1 [Saccharomyces cerevisiae]